MKQRYIILILSIFLILLGSGITYSIHSDFGKIEIKEVFLETDEGTTIHGLLYKPSITNTENVPGIVIIHGVTQSNEWLSCYTIELSRRGFAVLAIDAASHGDSTFANRENDDIDLGGKVAVEYLNNLPYIERIGIIGHSMGAGLALRTLDMTNVPIDSIILLGGSYSSDLINSTYPNNIMVAVGRYDELFVDKNIEEDLGIKFDITNFEEGITYGNFIDGTARRLVLSDSNHLFEIADPTLISETVDWFADSLLITGSSQTWIESSDLVFPLSIIGGLVLCLGIILSLFPITVNIMDYKFFKDTLKINKNLYEISDYISSKKEFWLNGLIYGLIGIIMFIPAFILSIIIDWPQSYGGFVSFWLVLNGVASLLVLKFLKKEKKYNQTGELLQWNDFAIDNKFDKEERITIMKSAIVAIIVILWCYTWTLLLDLLLHVDFRVILPLFNDLTFERLTIAPIYIPFALIYTFVEGVWLVGFLRTNNLEELKNSHHKEFLKFSGNAIIIKILPYLVILLIQVLGSFIIGKAMISGFLGFQLIFLYMLIPIFAIGTLFMCWSYKLTERIYIGGFFYTLIIIWMAASLLPVTL